MKEKQKYLLTVANIPSKYWRKNSLYKKYKLDEWINSPKSLIIISSSPVGRITAKKMVFGLVLEILNKYKIKYPPYYLAKPSYILEAKEGSVDIKKYHESEILIFDGVDEFKGDYELRLIEELLFSRFRRNNITLLLSNTSFNTEFCHQNNCSLLGSLILEVCTEVVI